jgi:hypothetical protein
LENENVFEIQWFNGSIIFPAWVWGMDWRLWKGREGSKILIPPAMQSADEK